MIDDTCYININKLARDINISIHNKNKKIDDIDDIDSDATRPDFIEILTEPSSVKSFDCCRFAFESQNINHLLPMLKGLTKLYPELDSDDFLSIYNWVAFRFRN